MVYTAFERLPHEVAILAADGTIVAVNDTWKRFADENHGHDPKYWVGANYFSICNAADDPMAVDGLVPAMEAVLSGERDGYRHEYPCHGPDEQRWFRLDAVRFHADGTAYLLVVHTNVTERMLAELRAQARTEQLETVLEVLRHDLRNPLNIIDGYAEMLAGELDEPDAVTTIRQAVSRISEIMEATFAFSDSGALSDVETVSVEDIARTAWRSVETGDATLTVTGSHRIIGDRRLLVQLFENLFRNAVEHAGPECRISVGVCRDGFYVEDDGPGIPESVRAKAVEADYSTRGTGGIGLAIVQAVVRAHGGTLVIAESADGGARFELTGFDIPPESSPARNEDRN